jgi:hypothetical protein
LTRIRFAVAKHDAAIISQIVDRAQVIARRWRVPFDRTGAMMDITAVHVNDCPLRLEELASADDFNFVHDVFGVFRHIDRSTGRLRDCFVPRYAVSD